MLLPSEQDHWLAMYPTLLQQMYEILQKQPILLYPEMLCQNNYAHARHKYFYNKSIKPLRHECNITAFLMMLKFALAMNV